MEEKRSVREWQNEYNSGAFESPERRIQINAGWYDWFCKDTSLANKTKRMGQIVKQIKDGGKVDLDNYYVWFKNNCPLNGPLFDDFGFAKKEEGEVQLTIQLNCCWNKHKFTVYGRRNEFKEPLFESDSQRELVKWLNAAWDVKHGN